MAFGEMCIRDRYIALVSAALLRRPSQASGSISRSVLGSSPTRRSASSQYSGSEVNWSQAMQLHFVISVSYTHLDVYKRQV